ncbi:MAG: hypothetical protein ACOYK6_02860 [Chthoniobacterales bacterium]
MQQPAEHKRQMTTENRQLPSQRGGSPGFPWSRFWTALGMLVLFLAALILVLRWNPEPMSDDEERALLRIKNLAELNKANEERLTTYGWVDQAHGVVHIPIERAMELEIKSLNDPKLKPHSVYPIAPIDLVPVPAGMPKNTK